MARKLSLGVMVTLIVILSLFGSSGQVFAAAKPSLSKYIWVEPDELVMSGTWTTEEIVVAGQQMDSIITAHLSGMGDQYVLWDVFCRTYYYNSTGLITKAVDDHTVFRVAKYDSQKNLLDLKPVRDGYLYFRDSSGKNYSYEIMSYKPFERPFSWFWAKYNPPTSGVTYRNDSSVGQITMFTKITGAVIDPKNPPPYAQDGYSDPNDVFPDGSVHVPPGGGTTNPDPNFPTQPTPPDNNWDLIGWLKYLVDWLIYLVKCFVYFLKSFGTAIKDVVTGSASLISAMTDFFAFLPNQVTTIIGMGLVAMIIVGIVKR